MNYYLEVLRKYAVFTGRSRRAEYWYFVLFSVLITLVLDVIAYLIHTPVLNFIYALLILIPSIAVGIRRLHDTGRKGWWLLIGLIPIVGTIILIVWFATDSQPGVNEYGPNPKGM